MSGSPGPWEIQEGGVAGPCMTCGREQGLVVVRNDVRLCFTCAMDAGKAAVAAAGFVPRKRGDQKET
jgi:hypothetical protein